jgi:geranylgeranyl pyrophosphate synthase
MTSIDDIKNALKPELQLLSKQLEDSLMSSNKLMNQVVEEYLRSKGKMSHTCYSHGKAFW